jgi:hypothetical protein
MPTELPLREAQILERLEQGGDVAIRELLTVIGVESRDPRKDQAYVGAYISFLNRRLTGKRIVPGWTKRTYRLTQTA